MPIRAAQKSNALDVAAVLARLIGSPPPPPRFPMVPFPQQGIGAGGSVGGRASGGRSSGRSGGSAAGTGLSEVLRDAKGNPIDRPWGSLSSKEANSLAVRLHQWVGEGKSPAELQELVKPWHVDLSDSPWGRKKEATGYEKGLQNLQRGNEVRKLMDEQGWTPEQRATWAQEFVPQMDPTSFNAQSGTGTGTAEDRLDLIIKLVDLQKENPSQAQQFAKKHNITLEEMQAAGDSGNHRLSVEELRNLPREEQRKWYEGGLKWAEYATEEEASDFHHLASQVGFKAPAIVTTSDQAFSEWGFKGKNPTEAFTTAIDARVTAGKKEIEKAAEDYRVDFLAEHLSEDEDASSLPSVLAKELRTNEAALRKKTFSRSDAAKQVKNAWIKNYEAVQGLRHDASGNERPPTGPRHPTGPGWSLLQLRNPGLAGQTIPQSPFDAATEQLEHIVALPSQKYAQEKNLGFDPSSNDENAYNKQLTRVQDLRKGLENQRNKNPTGRITNNQAVIAFAEQVNELGEIALRRIPLPTVQQQQQKELSPMPDGTQVFRTPDGSWQSLMPAKSNVEFETLKMQQNGTLAQEQLEFEREKHMLDRERHEAATRQAAAKLQQQGDDARQRGEDASIQRQIEILNTQPNTYGMPKGGEPPIDPEVDKSILPRLEDAPPDRTESRLERYNREMQAGVIPTDDPFTPAGLDGAVPGANAAMTDFKVDKLSPRVKKNPIGKQLLNIRTRYGGESEDDLTVRYATEVVMKAMETGDLDNPDVAEALSLLQLAGLKIEKE